MKPKLHLEDVLYSLNIGNAARGVEQKLTPVRVTKLGRKFFTVQRLDDKSGGSAKRYYLEDWTEVPDFTPNSRLFATEQEWFDLQRRAHLQGQLGQLLSSPYASRNIPLTTLEHIAQLLSEDIGEKF